MAGTMRITGMIRSSAVGGGRSRLRWLLDPPRLRRRAQIARFDGVVRAQEGGLPQVIGAEAVQPIHGPAYSLLVLDGACVAAGDALTEGSRCHRELLRVVGRDRYEEHLAVELELVFSPTGADPDTRLWDLVAHEQGGRLFAPARPRSSPG